jgi:3-phosphoshikimate 1-carboxyvinyltransferase
MTSPLLMQPFTRPVVATVPLPGSKSITNRALILAALSDGTITLTNALFSRDTRIMLAALHELGFTVAADAHAHTITVAGCSGKIPRARATIHVGNAGTAARFLTALLALHPDGEYMLDGDDAMRARPMAGLLSALAAQGATATAPDGTAASAFPFTLRTRGLRGGEIVVDATASSQLLSALLLVAPLAQTTATVRLAGETVSAPFVTMTLRMLATFGREAVSPEPGTHIFENCGPYRTPGAFYAIAPDATAASYFLALPIAAPATVRVDGLSDDGLQGDTAFAALLQNTGVRVRDTATGKTAEPPAGAASGGEYDFNAISDTFLTLAALAPLLMTPLTIYGIAHARKQETDRVLAVAIELEKLGQRVSPTSAELRADTTLGSITIFPDHAAMRHLTAAAPIRIRTYDDHRMAMSFAILGSHDLHGDGRGWLAIEDPGCCGKTFPDFFDVLAAVRRA